jgi:hypothetical protein
MIMYEFDGSLLRMKFTTRAKTDETPGIISKLANATSTYRL